MSTPTQEMRPKTDLGPSVSMRKPEVRYPAIANRDREPLRVG
jgi:hypothetical protein